MHKSKVSIRGSNIQSLLDSVTKIPEGNFLFKCGNAYVLTYEKFFQARSNMMVTLIFNFNGNTCEIDIVSGGGIDGSLFNVIANPEKGSNRDTKEILKEICESENWEYSEIS